MEQVIVRAVVELRRDGEVGKQRLAKLDFAVTPFGDPEAVVTRFWQLGPLVAHLLSGLQVVLIALELKPVRVAHKRAGLHAQQRIVGVVIVLVGVVRVVCNQDRRFDLFCDLQQLWVCLVLGRDAVVLDLDEQVVPAEDVLHPGRLLKGVLLVAVHQRLKHVAAEAPGGCDDTFTVIGKHFPVNAGFVVVPLHKRAAGELNEVLVAGVVLGQCNQVVVELLAAIGAAAGVVNLAPSARPFMAAVVGLVELAADDRFDPVVLAGPVKVQDAVHVAVVGDAKRRHAVRCRLGDKLVQTGRPVQHRVLGMRVQVHKRRRRTHA